MRSSRSILWPQISILSVYSAGFTDLSLEIGNGDYTNVAGKITDPSNYAQSRGNSS